MTKNPVKSKSGGVAFKASSGDRVANNHQQVKSKNLGVESKDMLKVGRNLARAQNQGN